MIKILFYHCNDTIGLANNSNQLYLGVAALYLKTYIDNTNPDTAKQLDWMIPIQRKLSDEDLIDYLNTHQPDILCTSNYIWNHSFIMAQLERVVPKLSSKIKIICGGPSIDVNIDPDFFIKYPYVEYAIYGAGEVAFLDIIKSKINNKKLLAFNTSNVAWYDRNKKKQVVAEFKYVPQLKWSPYLNNVDFFKKIVDNEHNNNVSIILPYDLTRGCPYSCTFCDWNSGLTNKTTRRKGTYKDEIDLFQNLKVKNLYLSDANVGQYDEDIEMISYLAQKNIQENVGFQIDGNFSKLKKENNFKIYNLMGLGNLMTEYAGFTISVQDINPEVLKNIDRPDVGWEVHLDMIRKLKKTFPHISSKVQLIQGLPGQTVSSWRNTLREITKENLQLQIFVSELLPASPAARDKTYQENFKFTYSQSLRFNDNHYFRGLFTESCISFSREDFVEMTILSHFYTAMSIVKMQWHEQIDCEKVVDYFLTTEIYRKLKNNLYNNWVNNDKFYYTINFDEKESDTSACYISGAGSKWAGNIQLIRMISLVFYSSKSFKDIFARYVKKENNRYTVNIKLPEGYT